MLQIKAGFTTSFIFFIFKGDKGDIYTFKYLQYLKHKGLCSFDL